MGVKNIYSSSGLDVMGSMDPFLRRRIDIRFYRMNKVDIVFKIIGSYQINNTTHPAVVNITGLGVGKGHFEEIFNLLYAAFQCF